MEKGSFIQEFIAGNVGGLIGICVVYPLDTAKIRMQTQKHYKSTSDVLRTMVKIDGIGSLYRGLASPALGFGLTFAISFRSLKAEFSAEDSNNQ
jgi:Mitochondrial carrier protein